MVVLGVFVNNLFIKWPENVYKQNPVKNRNFFLSRYFWQQKIKPYTCKKLS